MTEARQKRKMEEGMKSEVIPKKKKKKKKKKKVSIRYRAHAGPDLSCAVLCGDNTRKTRKRREKLK